jgi:peptidoglycan biosynthesis protein MviN/MurJ (putative lipid II flippase)
MTPDLDQTLSTLLAGGLSAVVYYVLYILDQRTNYHTLPEYARVIVDVAIASAIAIVGAIAITYALAWLGHPLPTTRQAWSRHLWQVLYLTLAGSTLIKVRDVLPTERARLARERADRRAAERALLSRRDDPTQGASSI